MSAQRFFPRLKSLKNTVDYVDDMLEVSLMNRSNDGCFKREFYLPETESKMGTAELLALIQRSEPSC